MTALAAVLAALAAGYGLGRYRPWMRLGDWANWQLRFHLARWDRTRLRLTTLFVLLLVTDPTATVRAWRRRNDPPAARGPALTFTARTRAPEETQ
ncbi:hypothetical protein ACIGZI_01130 [Streptomyces griseus]|uniref:hypothetical protein n=1 Tax=Streptomyces griseus TaxID=1911 RepID=UPI0037D388FD